MTSLDLLKYAEEKGIYVEYSKLESSGSCSVCISNDLYVIGLDEREMTEAEKRVRLAHEIGHCETGAFYNMYSPIDSRKKDEYTANEWAVKKLLPKKELSSAFKRGLTEVWQLAEEFSVTEDLVRLACRVYFNR